MSLNEHYQTYFTEFLPALYGQLLVEDLSSLTACFELDVTDSGEPPWRLAVEDGRLVSASHDGPTPACTFHVDSNTLINIVSARETAQDAYFDMRIEVTGDVEFGLMISTLLDVFFERYPFQPPATE